jgi:hypothetical protein
MQSNRPELLESRPPLSYADPALNREDRFRGRDPDGEGHGWRRLGFGFGLGFILLGIAFGEWPSREEAQFCLAVGGFVLGAAIPSIRPRRVAKPH